MLVAFCDKAYRIAKPGIPVSTSRHTWNRYTWALPYLRDAGIRAEGVSALAANPVSSKQAMQTMRQALEIHKAGKDRHARSSDASTKATAGAIATKSASIVSGANKGKAGEESPQAIVTRQTPRVARRLAQGAGKSQQMVGRTATLVYLHSQTHLAVRPLRTRRGRNMHNDDRGRVCPVH